MGNRWDLVGTPRTVASFNKSDLSDTNDASTKDSRTTTEEAHISKQIEFPKFRLFNMGREGPSTVFQELNRGRGYAWVRVDSAF